ncbi:MAG: response regulator [Sulfurimonas sp.]|nr:response regulator [Sulfurimonas sp.]
MTRIKILFIITALIFEVVLFAYLHYLQNNEVEQFKDTYKNYHIVQPLNATLGFYRNNAKAIYELFINNDEIRSMVYKANETDDLTVRAQERQKLFKRLNDKYQVFKQHGIKQLHFHLEDTTSFLRFHKPSKFGDDLSEIRYSLVLANKEKHFVEGFEEGRIFNGYRYVFPLSYEGKHCGTVEVSIGFSAIAKVLNKDFTLQPYMVLKDDVVKEKVFSNERRNYEESLISSHYYHEVNKYDNISKLNFDKETISQEVFQTTLQKYHDQLNPQLSQNVFFQYFDDHGDFSYILSFYPIKNIKGTNIGYIILMDKNYDYIKIIDEFNHRFIFLSFFFSFVLFFIYHLKKFNRRLLKSERRALNAAKAKSEFLANMSHEIRTPLNAILGYVNLLHKMEHQPKVKKYISTISSSSQILLNVINDILDFSKLENGKFALEMSVVNTKEVFEGLYQMFVPAANDKKISLALHYDSDIESYIKTDATRLKQIVINLLSNAVKFTPENGKIGLHVTYENEQLSVSVSDSGIGIPQHKQRSIFLKFEQADSSTTRKYGGTGLGLAISYFIVDNLGGKLYVQSEVDQGSTFSFEIPVEQATKPSEANGQGLSEDEAEHFKGHILLVEDNKTNQMMMNIILEELGIDVDTANDGIEAVEAYKKGSYNLILMDENMPNMNGLEASKEIFRLHKEEGYDMTPIIALTADAIDGARERYLAAGLNDYLSKPLNEKELLRVLNIYL